MGIGIELAQILGDLETIIGFEQQQAQQATLDTVFQQGAATLSLLQSVNSTLQAGLTTVEANQAAIIALLSQVLAKLPGTLGTGPSVTLPPMAPPGYGGASASDVWDAFFPLPGNTALATVSSIYAAVFNQVDGGGMIQLANQRYIAASGDFLDQLLIGGGTFPLFNDDLSLADPGDTPLTWIQRLNPGYVWAAASNGCPFTTVLVGGGSFRVICLVDQAMVDESLAARAVGPTLRVPPVWPGLANVVLGPSLPLADGLVVPGPLDGLLVIITSVPVPIGYYGFGAYKSYVRVGGVVFFDDAGNGEASQGIGGQDQVITPRCLEHAASATLRVKSGCAGTVIPWTAT